ncbi:MBL fold metallo-hydrolase [Polyangium sp. 6x1]|uniref:MBL fold metallo-hydrolase n=1 Tax=Polyangium sp. 6x1 TaxID=3042689 RepID=UPI0024826890|nr:MBL fold metallo-hydrolase [Polyangium sp. 6x1]MDI1450974.1 MBL fold metallo-hydrolase [Polyangium sp. 6x1]
MSSAAEPASKPKPKAKPAWRLWLRRAFVVLGASVLLFVLVGIVDGWRAFGRRAEGSRRARMEASPQYNEGQFQNPEPLWNDGWGMIKGMLDVSPYATPSQALPTVQPGRARFETPPPSGLRITWLGHSSMLIEIDGHRILTDPVWGERASPLTWIGPARFYAPPLPLEDLPSLDAVIISHDHYDHLDQPTIEAMKDRDTLFVAPLGVGAHLAYWGVPEARIVELDWWGKTRVRELEIVCTPARHASGRFLSDKDATLWAGYALVGANHRAYFSGDTGLFPALRDIGAKLGPFDVTMIEVGAYGRAWPDWHLGPEQAVIAHQMVQGRVLLPVHWGLFDLAFHGWTEPIERVLVAAQASGVTTVVPRPGESVEPGAAPPPARWWPDLPWRSGAQGPIVATKMGSDPLLPAVR